MEYYVTQPKDYWIAPNAVSITLNALGDANRIQASVASGAVIMCFVEDIKAESAGGEAGNGDGLWYGNNHEPKRWPLVVSPTYFNTDSEKYVYVAIPRRTEVGSQAVIVFPSEEIDIYGRAKRTTIVDEEPVTTYEQIGSTDYFYVYLHGVISIPVGGRRKWLTEITDWGMLSTAQGADEKANINDWFRWTPLNQTVAFLKKIVMNAGSFFQNINLGNDEHAGTLTGVATASTGDEFVDSETLVVTPSYIKSILTDRYIRKDQDDSTPFSLVIGGLLTALNTVINNIRSSNYTGDSMTDTGFRLTNDSGDGKSMLTIDKLYVRARAVFEELLVKKKEVAGGDQIFSCAANHISRTEYYGNTTDPITGEDTGDIDTSKPLGYVEQRIPWVLRKIARWIPNIEVYGRTVTVRKEMNATEAASIRWVRCYFLSKDDDRSVNNWWRKGDLAFCQTMNLVSSKRRTWVGSESSTKVGNVRWWRQVYRVSESPVTLDDGKQYHWFDLKLNIAAEQGQTDNLEWCEAGSDIPAAGDDAVQLGHYPQPSDIDVNTGALTDASTGRMNAMMFEVNGEGGAGDAPSMKILYGIYTYSLEKCWFGAPAVRMKLSAKTGYVFYGPSFKFIEQHDVVRLPVTRGAWLDITPTRDDFAPHSNVRKCYFWDVVTYQGSAWICKKPEGQHWIVTPTDDGTTTTITYSGVTYSEGDYVPNNVYNALPFAQQQLCSRVQNYTTDAPSASSQDWEVYVEKGADGGTPENRYQWNNSATQAPPLDATDPTATTPDSNWTVNAPNRPTTPGEWYLWMVTAIKFADGSYGTWGNFVRLTGEKGTAGEDGTDMEYIYILKTAQYSFPTNEKPANITTGEISPGSHAAGNSVDYDNTTNDWVPYQWWDNPQGIDATNKFEYMSWRMKPKGSSTWSAFSDPIVWSHFGKNGMDGDGVEYVFIRTKTDVAPQITDSASSASPYNNHNRHDSSASGGRTHDEDEYLPLAYITSGAADDIEANNAEIVSGGTPGMYGECTDDPTGTDYTWRYEWVIMRRMTAPNASGERQWTYFVGVMSQWSNFAKGYTIDNRAKTTSTISPNYAQESGWSNGDIVILNSSGSASAIAIYTNGTWEGADVAPGSNFLCEADGHVYQWNGTMWIDLGQYEGDSTYAMTPENLIINQPITGGNPVPTGSPEVVDIVVSSGEDEWSVGHGLTLSHVVVSETLPSGATSIGSTQASIASNGKLQITSIGSYQLTQGGAAQYYDRVDISVDLTFTDGVSRTINRTLHVYVNMIGKFKTIIQGDTETSVASKLEAAIVNGTVNSFINSATYIRSASEKTDTIEKQIYGNNLLPADGWTNIDGVLLGADNFDIAKQKLTNSVNSIATDVVFSAIFYLRAGQYTYSHYCSSVVSLYILTSEGRKERPSAMGGGETSHPVSGWRSGDTYQGADRMYVSFELSADAYVCLNIYNSSIFSIYRPMLERGSDVHDWETGATMRTSQIKQTAEQIDLNIRNGLNNTGINITNEIIRLRANKVTFTNSDGTVDDKISIDPTHGTLHAVDGDFDGTVRANRLYTRLERLDLNLFADNNNVFWDTINWGVDHGQRYSDGILPNILVLLSNNVSTTQNNTLNFTLPQASAWANFMFDLYVQKTYKYTSGGTTYYSNEIKVFANNGSQTAFVNIFDNINGGYYLYESYALVTASSVTMNAHYKDRDDYIAGYKPFWHVKLLSDGTHWVVVEYEDADLFSV